MIDALPELFSKLLSAIKKTDKSLSNLKSDFADMEARYDRVKLARSKFNSWRNSSDGYIYKQSLYKKQSKCCFICQINLSSEYFEIDHKLPLSIHPQLALKKSNMQLLCTPCNRKKSDLS